MRANGRTEFVRCSQNFQYTVPEMKMKNFENESSFFFSCKWTIIHTKATVTMASLLCNPLQFENVKECGNQTFIHYATKIFHVQASENFNTIESF